jgi:hypothetical protein
MGEVSTIGLDIAKSAFQVRGAETGGAVMTRNGQPSQGIGVLCVIAAMLAEPAKCCAGCSSVCLVVAW